MRLRATIVCEWEVDAAEYPRASDVYEVAEMIQDRHSDKRFSEHDILRWADRRTVKIEAMEEVTK